MTIVVPRFPAVLDVSAGDTDVRHGFRATEPVRGYGQWSEIGDAANWLAAQGGTLATMGPSNFIEPGSNRSYRFYAWPRSQVVARYWCFSLGLRGALENAHLALGTVEIPTGTARGAWFIDQASTNIVSAFHFVEPLASPSDTPGEISMTINVDAASLSDVFVEAVSCYEIPRATLDTWGPDPSPLGSYPAPAVLPVSVASSAPIVNGNAEAGLSSVDGVHRAVLWEELLQSAGRRSCLFSDWRPLGQTAGTSPVNLFLRDPAVLGRTRYLGDTTRQIAVAVYGSGPVGSRVRFDSATDFVEVGLPLSDDWATDVLEIDCEDPQNWGTDGGLRSATRDRIQIRAVASSSTCTVYGVCMGEPQI